MSSLILEKISPAYIFFEWVYKGLWCFYLLTKASNCLVILTFSLKEYCKNQTITLLDEAEHRVFIYSTKFWTTPQPASNHILAPTSSLKLFLPIWNPKVLNWWAPVFISRALFAACDTTTGFPPPGSTLFVLVTLHCLGFFSPLVLTFHY